jgi:hypothetical protein
MTIDDPRAFKKAWTTRTMSLLPTQADRGVFATGTKTMEHRRIAIEPPQGAQPPGFPLTHRARRRQPRRAALL